MIVYIDMDDVLCDYSGAIKRALSTNPKLGFPQSQYGFYRKLAPIEGALDAINYFIHSNQFDPYILTAPSTRNPFSYTEKRVWVEEQIGYDFVEKLIICSNKALLKGEILIDDNASGKDQENFEGKLIHFRSSQYPNWTEVLKSLSNNL